MRASKTPILINGAPWLLDFRRRLSREFDWEIAEDMESPAAYFQGYDPLVAWSEWFSRIGYRDYADAEAEIERDAKENARQHQVSAQPDLTLTNLLSSEGAIQLPVPFLKTSDHFCLLSSLLYAGFGAVETRRFHGDKVFLKNVPSVGARHGIEAYVSVDGECYYYDCERHRLFPAAYQADLRSGEIDIVFRPELYMWRYQTAACLVDVYLDLGHILGALSMVAALYDTSLTSSFADAVPVDLINAVHLQRIAVVGFHS
ncbi:trifolitoxin-processing protein TfxF [Rhizobium etli bv. phaseoli str. IE4803]|uniref:Trifolitoxin-processing protein TfxF n=1 Tax=Rhizobium etli bv. mimosae str. IE4771 TaxID=1432050 RepID=A0A060I815_RHIET|nr:hypothetical protein [Rhizobium sp. IE4771]AIC28075.1 trifolitoxin-processing protein TfxF [Rhizobium sp. IE4771]AJC80134.1 trifolitoxin-processing protein TfxF [Rhizobium etli bv. phaseoli str. IE4803]